MLLVPKNSSLREFRENIHIQIAPLIARLAPILYHWCGWNMESPYVVTAYTTPPFRLRALFVDISCVPYELPTKDRSGERAL